MLTFCKIAAGCPSNCGGLVDYLLSQTIPRELEAAANYYERGTSLTRGEPAVSDERIMLAAQVVARGAMPEAEAFEALASHIVGDRMRTFAPEPAGDGTDRLVSTYGWMVVAGLQDRGEALDTLLEADRLRADPATWDWRESERRLEPQLSDAIDHADRQERMARETATSALRYEFDSAVRWERAKLSGEVVPEARLRQDTDRRVTEGLGIDRTRLLTRDEMASLIAGRRADGKEIPGKRYREAHTYTDRDTGEERNAVQIGAYDFCFSPHKSVSVAWAFADPAERAIIYAAHRQACEAAMAVVEQHTGQARIGDGGRDGSEPGHTTFIAVDHYTARPTQDIAAREREGLGTTSALVPVPGDPQLHTHHLVPNVVFCDSGRIGSLDTAGTHDIIHPTGALYQAHLAALLRGNGIEVAIDGKTGATKIPAVPEFACEHYSKKTAVGDHAAKEYAGSLGLEWEGLSPKRRAGLLKEATQGRIEVTDDPGINKRLCKDDMPAFDEWRKQAEAIGYQHQSVITNLQQPELSRDERIDLAYTAALPWLEKTLNEKAILSPGEIRTAATRGIIAVGGTLDSDDVSRVTKQFWNRGVRQYGEMTTLTYGREEVNGRERIVITTDLHERDERDFVRLAQVAAGDRSGALTRGQVDEAVINSGLTLDDAHGRAQLDAVHRLGEGGRLGVFIAAAGAGKTSALNPLVSAWHAQGRDVHGIALGWQQADNLVDAGIQEQARVKGRPGVAAVSVFKQKVENGEVTLSPRSVIVVDEISMLGTRQGLDLLRMQERHGFRMVILGDDKQCEAIEAGSMLALARKALGEEQVPTIETTRRQSSAREREIVGLLRAGKAAEALAMKREDGTAEMVSGGYRECVERTARYVGERLAAGVQVGVSTATNIDAHRLGVAIRTVRRELGQIGDDRVSVRAINRDGNEYQMPLAPGDKVRLFRSINAEGQPGTFARNGTVMTLVDADGKGMLLRNARGREGRISWSRISDDQGRIQMAYGEALTTQSTQSATHQEHVHSLPGGTRSVPATNAYSSGTRHVERSQLILSEGAERRDVERQRPENDRRPITGDDVWANVASHFSRHKKKELASEVLSRAWDVTRASARGLRSGAQRIEAREARSQQPTLLHETAARAREERGLLPSVERAADAVVTRIREVAREVGEAVRSVVRQRAAQQHERREEHRQTRGMGLSM